MATFTLQRCKFRDGWLVPKKGEAPEQLEWKKLCERLAPSGSLRARSLFRQATPNSFIGLLRQSDGKTTNFVFQNLGSLGDVRAIAKANPMFERQLVDVYRVEKVVWEDRMIEANTPMAADTKLTLRSVVSGKR